MLSDTNYYYLKMILHACLRLIVCLTPPENPLSTKCGHTYCIDGFEGLCAAAGSAEKDFSITCLGSMGKCQVVFTLDELQDTFEDVLESSFSSYIQRHPQSFRYCPKPDCGMIYRVTSTNKFNTCAKCLTVTCTSCHVPHEGKTCAEYKDEAVKKLKKKLGIKDCPECTTPLEKTDGCNHMTCTVCVSHLCWVCLEFFSASGPCYDHMNAKHGGIGLDHLNGFH